MSSSASRDHDQEQEPVVITDKRKIDRDGRGGGTTAAPAGAEHTTAAAAEVADVADVAPDENAQLLAERTADLQRLQAEYANYRKRADRERLAAGELATGRVLADFLPVVDNLDRARQHGDLTGGLKAVADQLDGIFAKLGLVSFGEVGDPFDPSIHEAVLHDESPDVEVPTCTTVMRPGYKHHDRLLRPAMVGVSDPTSPFEPTPVDTSSLAEAQSEPEPPHEDNDTKPTDDETAG